MLADSPGTIILPTSEVGRFALFTMSLAATQQPPGTNLSVMCSASVTENINTAIRQLRSEDEWVWLLGDDHAWTGNVLLDMLDVMDAHDEIDILVPLVTKRNPPWHLVVFNRAPDNPDDPYPQWEPWKWEDVPASGVFEIDAAGSAGMLIRRRVLDTIGDPWFRSSDGLMLNEDVEFCRAATELGFRIFATSDLVMGHIGIFTVRPMMRDGRWGALTEFSTAEDRYRHVFVADPQAVGA